LSSDDSSAALLHLGGLLPNKPEGPWGAHP